MSAAMPIDLPALFEVVSVRHIAIGEVTSGPEQLAIDSLVNVFLVRGREALERFTRHGTDADTERLLYTACAAGLAFKKLLLASGPIADKRPELTLFLADLQLLRVELFERISGEQPPGPPRMLH
jgi:hypothetical protein